MPEGAFYGQEGAFWDQEGAALRARQVRFGNKKLTEGLGLHGARPPAAVTSYARVIPIARPCIFAATPLQARGFFYSGGVLNLNHKIAPTLPRRGNKNSSRVLPSSSQGIALAGISTERSRNFCLETMQVFSSPLGG